MGNMIDLPTESEPVTVIQGDCLEVLRELPDGCVDAVVTSPPYNQMSQITATPSGSWADSHGGAGFVRNWMESGYEDEMPEDDYQAWLNNVFGLCTEKTNATASLFFNHQCRWRDGVLLHPVQWFHPQGWQLREEIIWDKAGGMMSNAKMFCRFDERILWLDKGRHKWNQDATGYGTIWRIARMQQQQGKLHPVEFPVEIPRRCIVATTDPGDMILDPFAGSGTTGVAAIMTGRRCILIEKEPAYVEICKRRVAEAMGRGPGSLFKTVA